MPCLLFKLTNKVFSLLKIRIIRFVKGKHCFSGFSDEVAIRKPTTIKYRIKYINVRFFYLAWVINILSINTHNSRDISRPFHSSLNLKRCYTGTFQFFNMGKRTKVLKAHKISRRTLFIYIIHQSARLCTLASVARAPAYNTAHQALSGIAHTKRAVSKNLKLGTSRLRYFFYALKRYLSSKNNTLYAIFFKKPNTLTAANRHLSAGVNR